MEEVQYQDSGYSDFNQRIRDMEEKQRLLKERTMLIGQSLIDERTKTFNDIQDMKKTIGFLKEENIKIKEMLQRVLEQVDKLARKEELMILQRQFDMFRGS